MHVLAEIKRTEKMNLLPGSLQEQQQGTLDFSMQLWERALLVALPFAPVKFLIMLCER
jgi:hypothetical protein